MNSFSKIQNSNHRVLVWDETLRDGEQMAGVYFPKDVKLCLLKKIDELGVDIIDIGFPLVSNEELDFIRTVAKNKKDFNADLGITLRATCNDVEFCKEIEIDNFFLFSPTSNIHIKNKIKTTPREHLKMILKAVALANKYNKEVVFISEDTIRSDIDYLFKLVNELYNIGVNKIIITDTVGIAEPFTFYDLVKNIITSTPSDIKWGVHCHNDFGLAVANTISSVKAGVKFITVTINGIGERSGNASIDESVIGIENLFDKITEIKKEKLLSISKLVEEKSGIPISFLKPFTGSNAFKHESGIHVDGIMKYPLTYEPISPEIFGAKREFVMGKHSSKKIYQECKDFESLFKASSLQDKRSNFIKNYRSYEEEFCLKIKSE